MAGKVLAISAAVAALATIRPEVHAAGAVSTPWVSLTDFKQIAALISVGALGANGTIDAKLEQATDGAGAGQKDLDGAAITQLTQAGDDDSDKQVMIECHGEDLDLKGKFTHVRLTVDVGTAACGFGATIIGMDPRYAPASKHNPDSVAEIVTVGSDA